MWVYLANLGIFIVILPNNYFLNLSHFINIHTHQSVQLVAETRIYNLSNHEFEQLNRIDGYLSAGLHPWFLDETTFENDFLQLQSITKNPKVIAIGECGLDRTITKDFSFQKQVFIRHIELAQDLQKPLIIHCVRAFEELLAIKKQLKPTVPMIVHGFNNKPQIAQQLIKHGFYLSLGAALFNSASNASKTLPNIPLRQLFLETDDKNCTIQRIFTAASEQLSIPIEVLQKQMEENFREIF
jgi:TatD DNase family protein